MADQNPTLIIFGGTFDPPHAGHAACIMALCHTFPLSKILVIPAADPPPTQQLKKKPLLSFEVRSELCETLIRELGVAGERIEVSRIEGTLPKPNFTVNTLEALAPVLQQAGQGRPAITIGADQFQALDSWYRLDRINEIADFIIIPRGTTPIVWPRSKEAMLARLWTVSVKTPNVSSTAIREAMEKGLPPPRGALTPAVLSRLQELGAKAIQGDTR
ncbi:MAG: nicotinate (nicotinamide) nucleotide adenylyltransferase [Pseudomonadota bacterium]|jgi:nicotinate-nucleotide adenylyltransferase